MSRKKVIPVSHIIYLIKHSYLHLQLLKNNYILLSILGFLFAVLVSAWCSVAIYKQRAQNTE